jgi:predicted RNA binding protein YcfA (HicA-like mRNA interferase family)
MKMPKKLNQLRSGKEFVSYAEKRGAKVRQGKGSHTVVEYEGQSFVIPVHSGDLGKGLRHKIIKWFIAIGLGILAFIFILPRFF